MRALQWDYNPAPIMGAARKIKNNNFDADLQIARSHTAVSKQEGKTEKRKNDGICRSLSTCITQKLIIYISTHTVCAASPSLIKEPTWSYHRVRDGSETSEAIQGEQDVSDTLEERWGNAALITLSQHFPSFHPAHMLLWTLQLFLVVSQTQRALKGKPGGSSH